MNNPSNEELLPNIDELSDEDRACAMYDALSVQRKDLKEDHDAVCERIRRAEAELKEALAAEQEIERKLRDLADQFAELE